LASFASGQHWPRPPLKLAELIEREFGGFVPPKMFDDEEKQ